MSEDDRGAKAARAKALLAKRRQQKKAADSSSDLAATASAVASPLAPARTLTPAPSEPAPAQGEQGVSVDGDKRDIADVFGQDAGDSAWISSLNRASPPPSRVDSASPRVQSKPATPGPAQAAKSQIGNGNGALLEGRIKSLESINSALQADVKRLQDLLTASQKSEQFLEEEKIRAEHLQRRLHELEAEKDRQLETERNTIAFLVSEKASLMNELQKREDSEARLQGTEDELESERNRSQGLSEQLHAVQTEVGDATRRISEYQIKEKELNEKARDLEIQLQRATTAANESRKEAEETGRRLQDLTEQVQNDDRVDKLEASLKNSQDRADELEFQLSKLQKVYTSLKSEKDGLDSRFQNVSKREEEHEAKVTNLEAKVQDLETQIGNVSSERDTAAQEVANLRTQLTENEAVVTELKEKLSGANSLISTYTRQVQVLQTEVKSANRRADESEKTTRSLQLEGKNLMRSLDEMRPKIVELTDAKLDLAEQVQSAQRALKERDTIIEKLEASVDEYQSKEADSVKKWKEALASKEREAGSVHTDFAELQNNYNQLQEELDTALASIKTLEAQRTTQHQEASRRVLEIDRLNEAAQAQLEELSNVRDELDARRSAQDEEQGILERVQNELESLQAELAAKDEKIERLRQTALSPTATEAPRSLDEEVLSSIRQQHALEISAAHSQVRALEDQVHESRTKTHELQKQVSALQDQITRLQGASRQPPRSYSPSIPSRPSSRGKDRDLRRSVHNLPPPSALSRTVFDQALSPETLHKRKVSLSMLKARIESEVAVSPQPPLRTLSPVHSLSGKEEHDTQIHSSHHLIHRPQFLDESHVFWCSSCQGDLVIL